MSTEPLPSRLATPHVLLGPCSRCLTPLEFLPPTSPPSPVSYRIQCFQCGNVLSHSMSSHSIAGAVSSQTAQSNGKPSNPSGARKGRKIGTDERPLVGFFSHLPLTISTLTLHLTPLIVSILPVGNQVLRSPWGPRRCNRRGDQESLSAAGDQESPRQRRLRGTCVSTFFLSFWHAI